MVALIVLMDAGYNKDKLIILTPKYRRNNLFTFIVGLVTPVA